KNNCAASISFYFSFEEEAKERTKRKQILLRRPYFWRYKRLNGHVLVIK
ncbi:hypothetical protein H5410_036977, partial [Solanum commersonii]